MISISVVSHSHGELVNQVIDDLKTLVGPQEIELIITLNMPERVKFEQSNLPWTVQIVNNISPQGFGENHNAAFKLSMGEWFCVINPDIRLHVNPFPRLLEEMAVRSCALISPSVLTPERQIEDSIRHFPTLLSLTSKLFGRISGHYSFEQVDESFTADWIAGMFMLFRAEDFRAIGGFDEKFFLYYEDVDICARLWKSGRKVIACPQVQIIHDARRTSRKNLRYMRWHLASMARYFWKHWWRLPNIDHSRP